jgi:hypothetical protein
MKGNFPTAMLLSVARLGMVMERLFVPGARDTTADSKKFLPEG